MGAYENPTQAIDRESGMIIANAIGRIGQQTSNYLQTYADARNKELELITPALQALTEITHDPELVLNNLVPKEKIQIKDGVPVVVDGYEQLPVQEFVKNKLEKEKPYLLKNKTISGGGAPVARPTNDNFSEEMLKPFLKETESLVEQRQIYLMDKELWQKLRDVAKSR